MAVEIIRGRHNLGPGYRGCVATIGNFDGVHLGHRALIEEAVARARTRGVPAMLVTFEPQTPEYFAGESAPARLTRFGEKVAALEGSGIDRVLVLRFDRHLASLAPEAFVDEVLVEGLGVRELVVGDDFRFGRHGRGDFALLEQAGARRGFAVGRVGTRAVGGRRVSSTAVREALAAGDLRVAESLLGRPYAMRGRVIHGDRVGRTIGYPTANIALRRRASPLAGVFAVDVEGALEEGAAPGVANVGTRPTLGGMRALLEVHLLDRECALYGRRLEVRFRSRLRGERRFESLDALRAQIARDEAAARRALGLEAGAGAGR